MNCSFASPNEAESNGGEREMVERLRSIQRRDTLAVSNGRGRSLRRQRLPSLRRLREAYPEARILAGGTDVGLWVTKQLRELATVIYTGNVAELKRIEATEATLDIGAAVSLTDAYAAIVAEYPALDELARRFASPPIRNAGTLGGNVANGSPIGDSMPVLIALGATLVLRNGKKTRELALEQFYLAYQKTALAARRIRRAHSRSEAERWRADARALFARTRSRSASIRTFRRCAAASAGRRERRRA